MGRILTSWRIPAASLFSVLLVAGAYYLARGLEHPPAAQASEETALLQAIATKDSDKDGLPDWEEALYGTDPQNPDTRNLGMTDGQAVAKGLIVPAAIANITVASTTPAAKIDPSLPPPAPDNTLTAAFSKNFITAYLQAFQAKGGELSQADLNALTQQILSSLATAVVPAPDFKNMSDLTVTGSGAAALKTFAASAQTVMVANKTGATKSETEYLKAYLENGDPTNLDHLTRLAKAYRDSAVGLAALPIPQEIATDMLVVIDAFARISEIDSDFARVNSDPLAAMIALGQLPEAVQALGNAFLHMSKVYENANVTFTSQNESGAQFAAMIRNATQSRK